MVLNYITKHMSFIFSYLHLSPYFEYPHVFNSCIDISLEFKENSVYFVIYVKYIIFAHVNILTGSIGLCLSLCCV